jgi:hypothetical protein
MSSRWAGILRQSELRAELISLVEDLFTYPLDPDQRRTVEAVESYLADETREVSYTQLSVLRQMKEKFTAFESLPPIRRYGRDGDTFRYIRLPGSPRD